MQGSVTSAVCMCQAQGAMHLSWEVGGDGSGTANFDAVGKKQQLLLLLGAQ